MKQQFFTRFVDESRIRSIPYKKDQDRYWAYTVALFVFSLAPTTLATFVGYNLTNPYGIVISMIQFLLFFFFCFFSIKMLILDSHYKVFKKKRYRYFFIGGFFLLSISFSTLAAFTTEFVSYPNFSFEITVNILPFALIFIPLFLAHSIFCGQAISKLFEKIYRENAKARNNRYIEQKDDKNNSGQ